MFELISPSFGYQIEIGVLQVPTSFGCFDDLNKKKINEKLHVSEQEKQYKLITNIYKITNKCNTLLEQISFNEYIRYVHTGQGKK
jgi:hypothetical protein